MSVKPVAHVEGKVRSTSLFTAKDGRVIGVKCQVLTEPAAGFLEVLVTPDFQPVEKSLKLTDSYVTWQVALSAWGQGNLAADLVEDLSASAPPAARSTEQVPAGK